MKIVNTSSKAPHPPQIVDDLVASVTGGYDLGVLFLSPRNPADVKNIVEAILQKVQIKNLIGCTGAGIITTHEELEYEQAASLHLYQLPGVQINSFYIDQAQLLQMQTKEAWQAVLEAHPNESPAFIVLADPFRLDLNLFMQGLNEAYPGSAIVGGLASGANTPGGNILIFHKEYYSQGAVGVVLRGNVIVQTVVSQGCRPFGETFIVTKAEKNLIYEIAGKKFIETLRKIFEEASTQDRVLAQQAIFVGVAMDEYKHPFKRGDFLIRGLLGIDERTGAGVIGDAIKAGQTIQFHVRDAQSAREDLNELLQLQQINAKGKKPRGALVFCCNGRGQNLFQDKNHDINILQSYMGGIPAAGFFCAGEIGPVGQKTFLHGFTDSIALFYPKTEEEVL